MDDVLRATIGVVGNVTVVHHLSVVDLVQPPGHGGRVGRCRLIAVFVPGHSDRSRLGYI